MKVGMIDRTESCLTLNLLWCRAFSHLFKTCLKICVGNWQILHCAEIWPLNERARLALDGKVLMVAL